MNFVEYHQFTNTVAIYPKEHEGSYLLLGLISELSELVNSTMEEDKNAPLKELGDCYWYLVRYAEFHFPGLINDVDTSEQHESMEEEGESFDHMHAAYYACSHLASFEKKYIRDKVYDQSKNESCREFVIRLFALLECFVLGFESDIETVLQMNVDKLSKRKDSGTIGGSGDNR